MTQPIERRQIAATTDGQPIFVPRQVGPGQSQPVGELADGQPVWPLPSGGPTYSGPAPFGLLSSGQPVWAELVKASQPFYKKKRVLIPAAVLAIALVGSLGDGNQPSDTVEPGGSAASEQKIGQTSQEAGADKAAADKAAADKAAAVVTSAQEMISLLKNNALNAKNTYKDKRVSVSGFVGSIDASGNYFSLDPEPDALIFTGVQVYTDEKFLDQLASLSAGQAVTVTGTVTDVGELMGYSVEAETIK